MKQEDGRGIGDPVHKYYSFPSEARDFSRGYFTKEDAYEVTYSSYHDERGEDSAYWEHEVKIQKDRFIVVRIYVKTRGLLIVKNSDGSAVYRFDGTPVPDFPYNERSILAFVQHYYEKNEKEFEEEL